MKNFIRELRRREVFRTAGLYVGICWILIEVGSVVLPTFDAPEWLFRGAIVAAFAGFPVMLLLAWFFDVKKEGISLQADAADSASKPLGPRKSDLAIIGVLLLALVVSLSLNLKNETPNTVELEPVLVSVANFQNSVDDPLFENVLEEALTVGVEVAPNVVVTEESETPYEGRQLLLTGSMQQSGTQYRISVEGIDVFNGSSEFTISEKADSRDAVLDAIAKLSVKIRKRLGDADNDDGQAQSFMAKSLEAAHAYANARQFERGGRLEDAAQYYEQAAAADPSLGRAFAGLALVEFVLDRTEAAAQHWTKALSLMNTLTERERLRSLGRYATFVANDYAGAAEIYSQLVEKYPADIGARTDYAAVSFRRLKYTTAAEETARILDVLPADYFSRTKLALYAMYIGDWEMAIEEASRVIDSNPEFGPAYLPLAMSALARGQDDAAGDAYQRMAQTTQSGSVAELGLADIDLYFGQFNAAQVRLQEGIDADIENGKQRMAALKYIALAQSHAELENVSAAVDAAANALSLANDDASNVAAAMIYIRAGDLAAAKEIASTMSEQSDANSRAYGQMLNGMVLESDGAHTEAILAMRDAVSTADLWLIRYQIGRAYLRAGSFPEALGELTTLKARRGEATALFLDDMPTYRSLAELPYWTGRVQEELNMGTAALASYREFIALRPNGGVLAEDASERAARLE